VSRNLDATLAGALSAGLIQPAVLVMLTLQSGVEYVWSGIGDLVWNGITFKGVGTLGSIGPIGEGSAVKADGTTVTLSGIGLSSVDLPNPPVTPPTLSPPAGQSVAWAYATIPPVESVFSNPPDLGNFGLGCSGAASGGLTSGSLAVTNGQSVGGPNLVGLTWSGFFQPPEIPLGALITGVYPVVNVSAVEAGGFEAINCVPGIGAAQPLAGGSPPGTGLFVGATLGTVVGGVTFEAIVQNSLEGAASLFVNIAFLGLAVYYEGTPQTKTSLLYEALQDIRMGAPAKIWYGLRSNGAFLGTPYLIFSGTVDKPTLKTSAITSAIVIALENRLVNLQRPNARRYTAADQHLYYADDSAFNWVEILNDMALVWG